MSPVPDDEEAGIVLIQAVSVCSVVNPVVTGGVEDQLQRPEVGHQLGVDPELVEQVQLFVNQCLAGRYEESQGQVERLEIHYCGDPIIIIILSSPTTLPKLWKADCLRAVVRLYSSEEWWTW